MEKKMKKVGIQMSLLMSVTLSFFLSLTGNLTAKVGFKPMAFIVSFIISTIISLIIGLVIPMRKIEGGITKAIGLKEHSLPANIVSALISDLIYTPVITLAMVALARKMAMKTSDGHAELPPFIIMFLGSLVLCFIVAFIIILIVSPLFLKLLMKLNGIQGPPAGGSPAGRPE